jgi:N-acetylmuramic acid 6-phosphate (MurNAc-6-P) etherase
LLQECGGEVKTAIVRHCTGSSSDEARRMLHAAHGHLRKALESNVANGVPAR